MRADLASHLACQSEEKIKREGTSTEERSAQPSNAVARGGDRRRVCVPTPWCRDAELLRTVNLSLSFFLTSSLWYCCYSHLPRAGRCANTKFAEGRGHRDLHNLLTFITPRGTRLSLLCVNRRSLERLRSKSSRAQPRRRNLQSVPPAAPVPKKKKKMEESPVSHHVWSRCLSMGSPDLSATPLDCVPVATRD